ncbi:BMC_2a_G0017990.mRNA.1.CDS.1 [Saccharomyces cerevisiae]|nr:BMB_G0017970.mRNA.1.CDS.1 [Saccharomyces cerevisiae]CAI4489232.1 BMC_2a_G0017990.mRNA.1.CDS.1 [Saccharomyces cerevisiae]CAI7129165.1 BMC_2a_G0017990.mRNA.1.CDS.1 [Saccharomyces cerevisiae]CAI7131814.1 BMB_G0017970.mRNA.1.CDS.1 [Saccharomyces cerevisiae]
MTDCKTNLPVEPIFEEAEDDSCPSIENFSHLSVPTVEENKDFSEYNGEEAEEVVVPEKPASAYATVSIMCLCMAFGGFMSGWDTGTISGFVNQTDFLRRFGYYSHSKNTYYLSNVRTGLIVSIFNVGSAIGFIVVYMVGVVIQIASIDKWYQYFIGRIIAGIGAGSISVLAPMLISETAPKHIRGTLLACWQLMVTFAIFLGYCTNYGTKTYSNSVQWRVPLGLCFAWAIIMIGGMTFVPESPRFLVQVGKIEQAKASFAKSNKLSVDDPAVVAEIDLLVAGVEAEEAMGTASWKELFSRKTKVFQRLTMTVIINSLQQLTGDNYFFYYGTTIFKSVGMNDSFETSIVLGIVNFASCFFSLYSVDKLGRRRCLLLGAATMTACMVIYASVGVTRLYPNGKSQPSSKGAGNCMIVFTCFYIFCFSCTWGPVCYVIISETFPLRVRSKCMSVATAANLLWGFLIGFFTPFITSAINFYYGYVFMGCLAFSYFYVFFFVPETKGLALEEVDEMWMDGVLPWKSESWIPASRRDGDYDNEKIQHDGKPFYKRML